MTCSECLLLKFNFRASLYKSKHGMWQEGAGKVMAKMNEMAAQAHRKLVCLHWKKSPVYGVFGQ